MNLTEHFTLDELTHTDHRELENTPNEQELANLKRLAEFLEKVKGVLGGKPVMVNSITGIEIDDISELELANLLATQYEISDF